MRTRSRTWTLARSVRRRMVFVRANDPGPREFHRDDGRAGYWTNANAATAPGEAPETVAAIKADLSTDVEFDDENAAGDLLNALPTPSVTNDAGTAGDTPDDFLEDGKGDDGQALIDAVSSVHGNTVVNKREIDTLKSQLTDADGNLIDLTSLDTGVDTLTAMDEPDTRNTSRSPPDSRVPCRNAGSAVASVVDSGASPWSSPWLERFSYHAIVSSSCQAASTSASPSPSRSAGSPTSVNQGY